MQYEVTETIKIKNSQGQAISLQPGEVLTIDHVEDGTYLLRGENILAKTSPTVYVKTPSAEVLPVSIELFDRFFYEKKE